MSQDITAGDSTPKLSRSSVIDTVKALNLWYKFIELTDDFTTAIQFNKATLVLGSATLKNTASDAAGLKVVSTTGNAMGLVYGDEPNNVFKVEAGNIPLYLNTTSATSRISLRVNNAQIAQVTSTGVGIGVTPAEQLSVGTSVNGTGATMSVYALTSTGVTTWASFSQGANNANLTIAYGQGSGGTGKHLVFQGGGGGQSYLTTAGDFGLATLGPLYAAYSGGRYFSAKGNSGPGAIELWTNAVDAAGLMTGSVYSSDANSTQADKRLAALEFGKDGTTANNRGGFARLLVKQDGVNGLNEIWRVHNTGQMSIGVNAPFSDEKVRIYAAGGAKLLLSDANNVVSFTSIPISSTSELAVGVNGAEVLRVDRNFRLGIQTSTPAAKLDIGGPVTSGLAQAIFARGPDVNFQLVVRNGSGVNAAGENTFQIGSEYASQGTALTGGFKFVRGGNAGNMTLETYADSTKVMTANSNAVQFLTQTFQASSLGRISTQTNITTAGLVLQPAAAGVDGTDGAFITFRNLAGTKAFSVGMDLDGEFKVGGGTIGTTAYKIHHDGYNPGAMMNRGVVNWIDADLYRATGTYQLRNAGNSASYSLVEFSDIGGSTARIQLIGWYGGSPYAGNPDELYFRTTRDTQTNWDSMPTLNNRIWHSGNLDTPVTKSTDYATPNGTYLKAVGSPANVGETFWSTPSYGISQGDNKTHFGYLIDTVNSIYYNYIRGDRTVMEGGLALGGYPYITSRISKITVTYAGSNTVYGMVMNNLDGSGNGTAIQFCAGGTQSALGTTQGSITTSGSSVAYNTTSDLRLKSNVRPAPSASEIVQAIDVVSYDFTETGEHVEFGVGAQQLEPLAPQAVTKGNDTVIEKPSDVWQVDHSKLVPLLLKAQQEMLDKLAVAQEMIISLQQQVSDLKKNA